MKKRLAVLFGGRSVEHEISVITALQLMEAVDTTRYEVIPVYVSQQGPWYTGDALLKKSFYPQLPEALTEVEEVTLLPKPGIGGLMAFGAGAVIAVDVCVLAFHGTYGEDGCIQGLCELADLPYTGCSVLSSAVCMNKAQSKMIARDQGIPVLPFTLAERSDARKDLAGLRERIVRTSGLDAFPLFVKPCHLGSSIGVGVAHDMTGLDTALARVFQYETTAIIEPCVTELMEINVSVLGGEEPEASVVEIPVASGELLSYEDKYLRGGSKAKGQPSSQGMAGLTRVIDPQDLDPQIKADVIRYGLQAFQVLECSGVARLDFIYDLQKEQLYFNEINPIPGSFSFYLWDKSAPALFYPELIDQLVEQAEARHVTRGEGKSEHPFLALSR